MRKSRKLALFVFVCLVLYVGLYYFLRTSSWGGKIYVAGSEIWSFWGKTYYHYNPQAYDTSYKNIKPLVIQDTKVDDLLMEKFKKEPVKQFSDPCLEPVGLSYLSINSSEEETMYNFFYPLVYLERKIRRIHHYFDRFKSPGYSSFDACRKRKMKKLLPSY